MALAGAVVGGLVAFLAGAATALASGRDAGEALAGVLGASLAVGCLGYAFGIVLDRIARAVRDRTVPPSPGAAGPAAPPAPPGPAGGRA